MSAAPPLPQRAVLSGSAPTKAENKEKTEADPEAEHNLVDEEIAVALGGVEAGTWDRDDGETDVDTAHTGQCRGCADTTRLDCAANAGAFVCCCLSAWMRVKARDHAVHLWYACRA